MVKPRQGSGARSIHRADDAEAAEFFVATSASRRWCSG